MSALVNYGCVGYRCDRCGSAVGVVERFPRRGYGDPPAVVTCATTGCDGAFAAVSDETGAPND